MGFITDNDMNALRQIKNKQRALVLFHYLAEGLSLQEVAHKVFHMENNGHESKIPSVVTRAFGFSGGTARGKYSGVSQDVIMEFVRSCQPENTDDGLPEGTFDEFLRMQGWGKRGTQWIAPQNGGGQARQAQPRQRVQAQPDFDFDFDSQDWQPEADFPQAQSAPQRAKAGNSSAKVPAWVYLLTGVVVLAIAHFVKIIWLKAFLCLMAIGVSGTLSEEGNRSLARLWLIPLIAYFAFMAFHSTGGVRTFHIVFAIFAALCLPAVIKGDF